ncbi:hypothetical protein ADS79_06070 [Brevibacillus reuszeri]|uniref:Uncharacterized protein n=1 Tax=Brevibacillus reuszeri TaxID=54915 RepID=A0A0K9YXX4_9BACL|nr:hypothetical protein ADS79_06070 [Brevibacillus reuszeri]
MQEEDRAGIFSSWLLKSIAVAFTCCGVQPNYRAATGIIIIEETRKDSTENDAVFCLLFCFI